MFWRTRTRGIWTRTRTRDLEFWWTRTWTRESGNSFITDCVVLLYSLYKKKKNTAVLKVIKSFIMLAVLRRSV